MTKEITCIECPQGCRLIVEISESGEVSVSGNNCSKGEVYGKEECVYPKRTLTSSVVTHGLNLQRVPVKTDKPIPKEKLAEAMEVIRKFCLQKPVECGEVVIANFLQLDVNLVATRKANYLS